MCREKLCWNRRQAARSWTPGTATGTASPAMATLRAPASALTMHPPCPPACPGAALWTQACPRMTPRLCDMMRFTPGTISGSTHNHRFKASLHHIELVMCAQAILQYFVRCLCMAALPLMAILAENPALEALQVHIYIQQKFIPGLRRMCISLQVSILEYLCRGGQIAAIYTISNAFYSHGSAPYPEAHLQLSSSKGPFSQKAYLNF